MSPYHSTSSKSYFQMKHWDLGYANSKFSKDYWTSLFLRQEREAKDKLSSVLKGQQMRMENSCTSETLLDFAFTINNLIVRIRPKYPEVYWIQFSWDLIDLFSNPSPFAEKHFSSSLMWIFDKLTFPGRILSLSPKYMAASHPTHTFH